ncbi:hypothetical protein ABZS88_39570 [Streptomyces sp. NPDC005480]|uniref:hypothetical protein n=1 Tax=Streptomyces sp. NPDC005480 TaxID=3154880 RepID=UPI0033A8BABF
MTREIKRGDVWSLPDDRDVLVVSLSGLDEAYGAVLGLVLHPAGRYPDTAMSVVIGTPIPCTEVAVNSSNCEPPTRRGTPPREQSPARKPFRNGFPNCIDNSG